MKLTLILSAALALSLGQLCNAQTTRTDPFGDYEELTDTKPHDGPEVWDKIVASPQLSWGSTDVRYSKRSIPSLQNKKHWQTKAWKGERVNAQAVLWTKTDLSGAEITVSDLRNGSSIIPASAIETSFVRYVMTDELSKDGTTGCGERYNKADWDSSMVADALDIINVRDIVARTTQPVWMNVWVPSDAKTGKYKGTLTVTGSNFSPLSLQIEIDVLNHTLPDPKDWQIHMDLWQNPYAVARYYDVPLWSKEHFDAMRPIMKRIAQTGQKAVTASIMHKPWAGQTEDHFDSMVFRMKKLDGSWEYDYTVFDKWVEFMMDDIGIDKQISCYTMIPWALSFDYFDQATNRIRFIEAKPGDAAYEDYWLNFLTDFSRHLREKGWFHKTIISMDERGLDVMKPTLEIIKKADPEFKISLAGHYYDEIQADLYDYCLSFGNEFPEKVLEERKKAGKISTVYTCCAEARPNTFTFSPPAEAAWLGWHVMAGEYDGYLRWAVNSWTADPLRDSRFRTWAAGDCYMIYPGNRSSIRLERFVEGIQDFEKIRILKEEFTAKGNKAKLKKLNDAVAKFTPESITPDNAAHMVNAARQVLNSL